MSCSPNLLPPLQMFVGINFLSLPLSSTHPSWVGNYTSILIWAYVFFFSSKVWKPLESFVFLFCRFWQSTPFIFEFTCLSFSKLWTFELFCFVLHNWHPLYPLSELMHSSFSTVFGPWHFIIYIFILSLSYISPLFL
jgi:hypothetical protein